MIMMPGVGEGMEAMAGRGGEASEGGPYHMDSGQTQNISLFCGEARRATLFLLYDS